MKKSLFMFAVISFFVAGLSFASPKFNLKKAKGIVAYYSFETEIQNKIVKDETSLSNDGRTNSEQTVLVDGKFGKALYFNGENEFLTFNDEVLSGEEFTICVWVKAKEWRNWSRIWDIGNRRPDVYCAVDGKTPGILALHEEQTGYQVYSFLSELDEWVHIAAVYGNGKMSLYQNGILQDEVKAPVLLEEFRSAEGKNLYFGRSNWNDPYFIGAMDEIVLAKRKLSAKEIKKIINGIEF